jgi:hypothetical protein
MSDQQSNSEGFAAFGLIWEYEHDERLWRYEVWSIGYDPQEGYILNFPSGTTATLRSTNLWEAMNEAAWYIGRYN